jgi:hypothetical protein
MFKVTKTIPSLSEHTKLEFVREIGFTHMRILEGMQTYLQLAGCVAKLCKLNMKPALFTVSARGVMRSSVTLARRWSVYNLETIDGDSGPICSSDCEPFASVVI